MPSIPENRDEIQAALKNTAKGSFHEKLINQIASEYENAWRYTRPRIQEGILRLKLYNNQKREKTKVGDPLLFTNHQSILSVLYDDKLNVEFEGREEGDEEVADNLNSLSEFDHSDMDKSVLDYEWDWDTLAFGRGLVYFNEFDLDSKTPIPEVWDPLTFVRDPAAQSINGNRLGKGAMRYGGREVGMTKYEMKKSKEYFNLGKLKSDEGRILSLTFEAQQARSDAHGMTSLGTFDKTIGDNHELRILQWFTHFEGKKYFVELGNERKIIVRLTPLKEEKWPIIDRPCFPMSHDWDGVSVFDILEDKQRFRSVLINLFGEHARADLHPMWLFDENKIKKSIDKNFGFNKWIPVTGDPNSAARPLIKPQISSQAAFILNFLDISSQRALAIPELQQGVPSEKNRTLGELQLVSSKVDVRQSLTARVWGWSEKAFWKRWYEIYDRDFSSGIHKKAIRLVGAFGPTWREIDRDKIITSNILGPDIKIESRVMSEAKKIRNYVQASQYMQIAFLDPNADRMYGLRELGKLIMTKDKVERLLPLTIDERIAKQENEELNIGNPVQVKREDNHNIHLRMHVSAKDNAASQAHIKAHETAMTIQVIRPELFPQFNQQNMMMQNEGKIPVKQNSNISAPPPEGTQGAAMMMQ